MSKEYKRVIFFNREALVLTITLNESQEPNVTNIKKMSELSPEELSEFLGSNSSGTFEVIPFGT